MLLTSLGPLPTPPWRPGRSPARGHPSAVAVARQATTGWVPLPRCVPGPCIIHRWCRGCPQFLPTQIPRLVLISVDRVELPPGGRWRGGLCAMQTPPRHPREEALVGAPFGPPRGPASCVGRGYTGASARVWRRCCVRAGPRGTVVPTRSTACPRRGPSGADTDAAGPLRAHTPAIRRARGVAAPPPTWPRTPWCVALAVVTLCVVPAGVAAPSSPRLFGPPHPLDVTGLCGSRLAFPPVSFSCVPPPRPPDYLPGPVPHCTSVVSPPPCPCFSFSPPPTLVCRRP